MRNAVWLLKERCFLSKRYKPVWDWLKTKTNKETKQKLRKGRKWTKWKSGKLREQRPCCVIQINNNTKYDQKKKKEGSSEYYSYTRNLPKVRVSRGRSRTMLLVCRPKWQPCPGIQGQPRGEQDDDTFSKEGIRRSDSIWKPLLRCIQPTCLHICVKINERYRENYIEKIKQLLLAKKKKKKKCSHRTLTGSGANSSHMAIKMWPYSLW